MSKDFTLSCSGGKFLEAFEITAKPSGITVLVGYNATLKSMIARSFLYCDERDRERYGPTLKDLKIEYNLSDTTLPCRALRGYVPDNRIVLRSLYQAQSHIWEVTRNLIDLKNMREEGGGRVASLAEEVERAFRQLLNFLGLSILNDLKEFKIRASGKVIGFMRNVFEEELEKLPKALKDTFEDVVDKESIVPLEILGFEYMEAIPEKIIPYVKILDARFHEVIKAELTSTSVIAPLLYEYIINFLSVVENDKILVIEEPEESMTPLQQVFTVKFLERAVVESDKLLNSRTYVIITTHSPYIAFATDISKDTVKLYFASYKKEKAEETGKIKITEEKPHRPFLVADYIISS